MSICPVSNKRTAPDQDSDKRVRIESNPFVNLPEDLWHKVTSYLNKSDLKSFSQVSHFDQAIALRALTALENAQAAAQLKSLSNTNPEKPADVLSSLNFYKDIVHEARIDHQLGIDPNQESELQKNLLNLSTNQVAQELLALKHDCITAINSKKIFFSDIEKKYASKTTRLLGYALNHIVSASINPETVRGFIVVEAASKGHLEIVNILLEHGSISQEQKHQAFLDAVRHGHLEIVKLLLQGGGISNWTQGDAVKYAAKKGYQEIVEYLVGCCDLSEDARGMAINEAAQIGHLKIVNILLNSGNISAHLRGWAAQAAAWSDNHEIVVVLLKNGPILEGQDTILSNILSRRNSLEIVKRSLDVEEFWTETE